MATQKEINKAFDRCYRLTLNPELTVKQVFKLANDLLSKGVIDTNDLAELHREHKGGYTAEDLQDVLMSTIRCQLD